VHLVPGPQVGRVKVHHEILLLHSLQPATPPKRRQAQSAPLRVCESKPPSALALLHRGLLLWTADWSAATWAAARPTQPLSPNTASHLTAALRLQPCTQQTCRTGLRVTSACAAWAQAGRLLPAHAPSRVSLPLWRVHAAQPASAPQRHQTHCVACPPGSPA